MSNKVTTGLKVEKYEKNKSSILNVQDRVKLPVFGGFNGFMNNKFTVIGRGAELILGNSSGNRIRLHVK